MNKYLVLYCATKETFAHWSNQPQEEGQKVMKEWMEWQDANISHLAEPGNPVGKNHRITAQGSEETSNEICGFSIVLAANQEEAESIISSNPHLKEPGTYLEVMPIMAM